MTIGYLFSPGTYRARCIRVVDGDTLDLVVDLGFRCSLTGRFRLLGIDTPELTAKLSADRERARAAAAYLTTQVAGPDPTGWWLRLSDVRRDPDSFGRWLAVVWRRGDLADEEVNINERLVSAGLAVVFRG